MKDSFVGIGLVFGAGIGVVIGMLFSLNLSMSIAFGAGIGLVVGAIISNLWKAK